ncbi:MAG: protein translocase subunit SecF [Rhodospirillales bacterium]|nr:protein translocase subunit SecF [Rhodospirillales bacterium]
MKGIRLIPEGTNINFIGVRYVAFAISLLVILGSFGLFFNKGLSFGIDFTGGTMIEIRTPVVADLGEMRTMLNGLGIGAVSIQEFGAPEDLLIRLPQQEGGPEEQQAAIVKVRAAVDEQFGAEAVEYRRTEFVGPQVGEELKKAGFFAIIFSLAGILVYIWFRFEWQFGVAAVMALAHDTIATVGLFSLTGMEFNLSTVAAVLMIAGYSINDTVVVFDRIRENLRKYRKKPLLELLNDSVNETLSRTILTSGTTIIALVSLWLFGGEVIRGFVNALVFGIVIGTYSSIFVAAPILTFLNIRREGKVAGDETSAAAAP